MTKFSKLNNAAFVKLNEPNATQGAPRVNPTRNLWCINERRFPKYFTLMRRFQRLRLCLVINTVLSTPSNADKIAGCVIHATQPTTREDSPINLRSVTTITDGSNNTVTFSTPDNVLDGRHKPTFKFLPGLGILCAHTELIPPRTH